MKGSFSGRLSNTDSLTPKFLARIDLGVWTSQSSIWNVVLILRVIRLVKGRYKRGVIGLAELPESVKVTTVKHQQNLSLIADTCLMSAEVVKPIFVLVQKTLDCMRRSLWKVPDITLIHVINLVSSLFIHSRHPHRSGKHISPF